MAPRAAGIRSRVTSAWKAVAHLGVPRLAEGDTRPIIATNQFAVLGCALALSFGAFMMATDWPRQNTPALAFLGLVPVWMLALFLNAKGLHLFAATLSLFSPMVVLGFVAHWYSTAAGFQFYLFAGGVLSFILFRSDQFVLRASLLLVSVGVLVWTEIIWPPSSKHHEFSSGFADLYLGVNICLTVLILYACGRSDLHYYERERSRNAELLERAQVAAQTDALTEVYNRRGIAPVLSAVTRRSEYALALVDLDRFKTINDKLGHGSGDVVLANAARTLAQSVGDAGVVARWGGEEFLVVIPGVSLAEADALMEKARAEMEGEYGTATSPVRVTISVGLAHAPRYSPKEEVLRLADANLYEAKSSGRNIVVSGRLASDGD